MSRSNPHADGTPNPAVRWFEWNGEHGNVRHYDKEQKKNITADLPFTFILLDQLGSVRGWDDKSGSGIYSNLVKDTRKDVLVVKSFKGGVIAEGVYKAIKDRVNAAGGRFNTNCYIAFKDGLTLKIGVLQFKGAALGAWMEFCKQARGDLYKKAVTIDGVIEGKKGRITFYTPHVKLTDISPQTDEAALELDRELQEWLEGYLNRNTRDQVESAAEQPDDGDDYGEHISGDPVDNYRPITDDDIPF